MHTVLAEALQRGFSNNLTGLTIIAPGHTYRIFSSSHFSSLPLSSNKSTRQSIRRYPVAVGYLSTDNCSEIPSRFLFKA